MSDPVQQLAQLYRDTAPALLAYFRRHLAVGSSAEDLLQDTFVRALRSFPRLQESVSPRAYLFGIARHVGLDARRRHHPTTDLPDWLPAPAGDPPDERLPLLRSAIDSLSPAHRETLHLKLQHELSYAEIAEVLGLPVGTVRSRLHEAVAQLRSALNPPPPAVNPPLTIRHESGPTQLAPARPCTR